MCSYKIELAEVSLPRSAEKRDNDVSMDNARNKKLIIISLYPIKIKRDSTFN